MNWKLGVLGVGALVIVLSMLVLGRSGAPEARGPDAGGPGLPCDPDDGGITLPPGFCATVFADDVGEPRHLAVAPNGDVFVALAGRDGPGGILALRDADADGRAERQERFGPERGGTGIALRGEHLYFGPDDGVLRYPLPAGALRPEGEPTVIVRGLPDSLSHRAKPLAISRDGALFLNIGSPSNACQRQSRTAGSPGMEPCPQLETRAGIWRFDADAEGQTQQDGARFATGLRNTVALALNPDDGELYGVIHGRDQLSQLWPDHFTVEQGAELPGEEFVHISPGDDYGWPYCYYDWQAGQKVLAPEYGGDGQTVGRCDAAKDPLMAFPGHWAPNALLFYDGTMFPDPYRGGAFIAFHGSWNRAPLPQEGYNVVFLPMRDGRPAGDGEVFADGFAGEGPLPGDAAHRPTGLAVGPDGALYVSDDQGGRIWRITYEGAPDGVQE